MSRMGFERSLATGEALGGREERSSRTEPIGGHQPSSQQVEEALVDLCWEATGEADQL